MKSLSLLLLFSLMYQMLPAQDLHVYYDMYRDTVWYEKNGKPVTKPRIKKGQTLHLHYLEYNNFLYEMDTDVDQTEDSDSGFSLGGLLSNGLSGLMPGMSGLMGLTGGAGTPSTGLPGLEFPLLGTGTPDASLTSLLGGTRGDAQIFEEAGKAMAEMRAAADEIKQIYSDIQVREQAIQAAWMVKDRVPSLLFSTALAPSEIKKTCLEYYRAMFRKKAGEPITVNEILNWNQLPTEIELLTVRLKTKQQEFASKVIIYGRLVQQIQGLDIANDTLTNYTKSLSKVNIEAKELDTQVKALAANPALTDNVLPFTPKEVAAQQQQMMELEANDFTAYNRMEPSKDAISITTKFYKKDTLGQRIGTEPVKTKNISMKVYGGLKISASIGVNFGQYASTPQRYYVRDSIIFGQDVDRFSPIISTMIHFYPYTDSKITIGGSFGIGLPILNGDGAQSAMFFISPTLMFGQKQRVAFSFGLMGGKVQRLGKGYRTGDKFITVDGEVPTYSRYEIGYFAGISFNILSAKR